MAYIEMQPASLEWTFDVVWCSVCVVWLVLCCSLYTCDHTCIDIIYYAHMVPCIIPMLVVCICNLLPGKLHAADVSLRISLSLNLKQYISTVCIVCI